MNIKNWKDTFESIGMLAIVASLIFVALQLKQDQLIARSQLGAGTTELSVAIGLAAMESGFQKTFAKMLNEPDQLSDDEVVELDLFYMSLHASMNRECYLVQREIFAECDNLVRARSLHFFQNEFAQTWWKKLTSRSPYIPGWVDEEIANLDSDGNRRRIAELRDALK